MVSIQLIRQRDAYPQRGIKVAMTFTETTTQCDFSDYTDKEGKVYFDHIPGEASIVVGGQDYGTFLFASETIIYV